MAYDSRIWLECQSEKHAQILTTLLHRDTRPLFAEDLPTELSALFALIEDLEFPTELEYKHNMLWVQWWDVRGFTIFDLEPILSESGCTIKLAFEVPDDPMSGDSDQDEIDGFFYVERESGLVRVNKEFVEKNFTKQIIDKFTYPED